MRMRFFGGLHPAVSFLYFAAVLALTLVCFHPLMAALSLVGAVCFSAQLNGWRSVGLTSRFVLPMFLFIAIANPIFNHRGVTMLCMLFDQWFTLEAVCYGLVSAASLSAVIFWFTCYQTVMTSDKFLFLFGHIAPNTALLITMTLGLIPRLQERSAQIPHGAENAAAGKQAPSSKAPRGEPEFFGAFNVEHGKRRTDSGLHESARLRCAPPHHVSLIRL